MTGRNSLPNHLFTDEINVNKFKRGLKDTEAHIKLYISFVLNIILTNHFVLALVIFYLRLL